MSFEKIFVIGMWHLGSVVSVCLDVIGHEVYCFDFNKKIIQNLRKGILPITEPGLNDLYLQTDIHIEDDFSRIQECKYVYITFDTPLKKDNSPDLKEIYKAVHSIAPLLTNQIIIISSQLPIGTSDHIKKILGKEVCYIPENLRLGNAIDCFLEPERLIFGLSSEKIKDDISSLFLFTPKKTEKIFTSLKTAEMVKHTLNSYLATMISFSGEISDICESEKISASEVLKLLKLDSRVSPKAPLSPGLGFSGGTLERDLKVLMKYNTPLIKAVYSSNKERNDKLFHYIYPRPYTKIGFLGVTYKKGTDTLRDSPCVSLIKELQKYLVYKDISKEVLFFFFDPLYKGEIEGAKRCETVAEVCKNSELVVIFTDYEIFKEISKMSVKSVIDTKNLLRGIKLSGITEYYAIGEKL